MSLILEALKKSEAERRLGRAPDLLTPVAPAREAAARWLPGFLLGVLGASLLAGGLAWWWLRQSQPASTAQAPVAAPAASPLAVAPPVGDAAAPPAAASAPIAPARIAAREPAEVIAHAPLPQDADFAGTERESVALPAEAIPLPPPSAPAPAPAPLPVTRPAPASVVAPAPAPATRVLPQAPVPPVEALPTLAMLLPAQREGLPPLRLTMHVYDADPSARFVLIDGRRHRQGDTIADGVVLDAIRHDGVVVARGGLRFVVLRP